MPNTEPLATALLIGAFGLLLVLSVLPSRLVARVGIPLPLVFLILGMIGGSEGFLGIAFSDYQFALRLGTIALVLILLDGGLNTSFADVRGSFAPATVLATVGVAITAVLVAVIGRLIGLNWAEAAVLGAVVSSTDAAAVFAVLRGARLRLKGRLGPTIELESGMNDPMAVILTLQIVAILSGIGEQQTGAALVLSVLVNVIVQLVVGLLVGVLFGFGARWLHSIVEPASAGLLPLLMLGGAFIAFGAATVLNGSGFLAVYIAAVLLGNGPLPNRAALARFHDALAWLSQAAMFLMLGLLVFPSQLMPILVPGLIVAVLMTVVARPIAVWACLWPFGYTPREMTYVSWTGLRGAVPIVLALFPILSDVPGAMKVFNLVFFVVVLNAVVPGALIGRAARWMGVDAPQEPRPLAALEIHSTRMLQGELLSFHVSPSVAVCGAKLADVPFPDDAAIILVVRGRALLAPRGATTLEADDHAYVLCSAASRPLVELLFGRPHGEES